MSQVLQTITLKFIRYLLRGIRPEYLALCIENNLYIIQTILWATKNNADTIAQELNNYNLTDEQKAYLVGELNKIETVWRLIIMIRELLRKFNIDKVITLEKMEELMQKEHPALYAMYLQYGERGREWLRNEIEYDLKPFFKSG